MKKIKSTDGEIKVLAVDSELVYFDKDGYAEVDDKIASIKTKFFKVVPSRKQITKEEEPKEVINEE